ncbi:MAG: type pilus assembly PilZ [Sphingomonadales bacterium]|nr:type pilus assembly PilZ [Sphingomonadales bacterium]
MLATVRIIDSSDRRQGPRIAVESCSTLRADTRPVDVLMTDLSETGFAIESVLPLEIGAEVSIGLPGYGAFEAWVVRKDGDTVGCAFSQPLDAHIVRSAFAGTNVMHTVAVKTLPAIDTVMPLAELEPVKWPRIYRALLMLGSSALLWALIISAVLWAVR